MSVPFGHNQVESHTITPRALCPDLVKFAYVPKNELLIHGSNHSAPGRETDRNGGLHHPELGTTQLQDSQDHVLVLEFKDSGRGQKTDNP